VIHTALGSENDVQQRADFSAKGGLKRATSDVQNVLKINGLAISRLLALNQRVPGSSPGAPTIAWEIP
jgi:hypothetical protein